MSGRVALQTCLQFDYAIASTARNRQCDAPLPVPARPWHVPLFVFGPDTDALVVVRPDADALAVVGSHADALE